MVEVNLTSRERNLILLLFFCGIFMGSLDINIIGPVLAPIQQTFHITSRESSWMYTVYVIAFMVGSPIMAKFSDFYGNRKIYVLDILLFGIGSSIIVFSSSIVTIFVGRIIQGFGAGGIFPVAASFIGDYFPIEKRGEAIGYIGAVFGISAIFGPIVGSLLIPYAWQLCFAINIPIAIALIFASFRILPNFEQSKKLEVDWLGIIFLVIVSTLFAYGLNQIDSSNFINSLFSIAVLPYLLLFIILMPVFIKIEKKAKESIVPIYMFKNKEISTACLLMTCQGLINAITIFIPSLAMISLGFNSETASLMLIPIVGTNAVAAPVIGRFLFKMGYKVFMLIGTLALTCGLLIIGFLSFNLYLFIIAGVLVGFGLVTLVGAPMRFLIICETTSGERGTGQGLINMLSSAGQLIGGALIGGLIASYNNTILGYTIAFSFVALFSFIAFVFSRGLKTRDESMATMKKNS